MNTCGSSVEYLMGSRKTDRRHESNVVLHLSVMGLPISYLTGQRILDLRIGTGALAREFAAQAAHVAGMDVAPSRSRRRASSWSANDCVST